MKNQFYDVFLGKKSERIIKIAKKKGWDNVLFLRKIKFFQDFKTLKSKLENYDGIYLETDNIEDVRKIFQNYKGFFLVGGSSETFNRKLCEIKISGIVNPERLVKKDYLHYRNSGFNHVTAKLCKKNEVLLITNFSELIKSKKSKIFGLRKPYSFLGNKKQQAQQIGRIMQNIKLARKYKTKFAIANFAERSGQIKNIKEIKEFLKNLNLNVGETSNALKNIYLRKIKIYKDFQKFL